MKNNNNEHGRTMVEMLGVLSIIGLISLSGLFGFSKGMHMYQLSKTIELTAQAIRDFSLFEKQDARGYSTNTKDMAENALKTGLMSECDVQNSKIAGENYGVCRTPLGEIYPKFFVSRQNDVYYYTYMLFVTFLKAPHQSCVEFLSRNWGRSVPKKLWKNNWRNGTRIRRDHSRAFPDLSLAQTRLFRFHKKHDFFKVIAVGFLNLNNLPIDAFNHVQPS